MVTKSNAESLVKNFKIMGDGPRVIGMIGPKDEQKTFKRPGSRRGTSKWRAAMVNMRLQSRMLNMRRMMPGCRSKGKATGEEIS